MPVNELNKPVIDFHDKGESDSEPSHADIDCCREVYNTNKTEEEKHKHEDDNTQRLEHRNSNEHIADHQHDGIDEKEEDMEGGGLESQIVISDDSQGPPVPKRSLEE